MDKDIFIVYAIISEVDGRIYVGFTNDLHRRIREHNRGRTKSTKAFKPWKLIYAEPFPSRAQARKKEIYLKGGSGKEFLKSLKNLPPKKSEK